MKMLGILKAAYDNLVSYIVPDPRPDPEDPAAYAFVADVLQEFDVKQTHYQMLVGGGQPTDVALKAPPELVASAPVGWAWSVDVYDGPKGKGYQVVFEAVRGGRTWRKVVNDGPEEWREQDWAEVAASLMESKVVRD